MSTTKNLALLLAIKQKRLNYWKSRFQGENFEGEQAVRCRELLVTFSQLLAKIVKAGSPEEIAECEQRLEDLERELDALFVARRLLTSEIGAAVTPEPHPGEAGH